MSSSYKKSTKAALDRYYLKQAKAQARAMKRGGKSNKSPEKDVEKEVLLIAKRLGFNLHVIESKAVYSRAAGRYLQGQAEAGLPDIVGNVGHIAVYCELKAKGRRSTLKPHQRAFLVDKINQDCFSVCVDSAHMFQDLWKAFKFAPSSDERKRLLLEALPKKKAAE